MRKLRCAECSLEVGDSVFIALSVFGTYCSQRCMDSGKAKSDASTREWVKMDECRPQEGQLVFLLYGSNYQAVFPWANKWFLEGVTHWAPLPDMPEKVE